MSELLPSAAFTGTKYNQAEVTTIICIPDSIPQRALYLRTEVHTLPHLRRPDLPEELTPI